jgi:sulfofructose kinase
VIVDQRGDRLVVAYHDLDVDRSPDWLPFQDFARAGIVHCDARWVEGAEAALRAAGEMKVPCMIDADVAPRGVLEKLVPLASHAVFSDAGLLIYSGCDDVKTALMRVGASCGALVRGRQDTPRRGAADRRGRYAVRR